MPKTFLGWKVWDHWTSSHQIFTWCRPIIPLLVHTLGWQFLIRLMVAQRIKEISISVHSLLQN